MDDQEKHTDFYSPAFWRACVALVLAMVSTSIMNVVVFPGFDAVYTHARDVSVTFNSAALLLIGLAATFKPSLLKTHALNAAMVACLAMGAVAMPFALAAGHPVALTVSASVMALGRAWAILTTGIAASRLSLKQAGACVSIAFVLQCALSAAVWVLPFFVGLALFVALPLCAWALSWPAARPVVEATERGEAPSDFSVTRPSSFLPLASQLFVCLFLFRVAFGCSLRIGEVEGAPLPSFVSIVPVAVVAVYVLVSGKRFPSDATVQWSVLLVVAGFLAAMMMTDASWAASVVMLSAGNTLFDMVAWVVLIAVAGRNSRGAVAVFAWGRGVSGLGTTLGAAIGVWANSQSAGDAVALQAVMSVLVLVFVGYSLLGLRGFSFSAVVDGVTPVEDAVAVAPKPDFDARCREVAERYGLTPREFEVFQMLARGRDRTYIQEQLVVSRNTVKSHVKHIYAKLDIHTHQDLIDLVEDVPR